MQTCRRAYLGFSHWQRTTYCFTWRGQEVTELSALTLSLSLSVALQRIHVHRKAGKINSLLCKKKKERKEEKTLSSTGEILCNMSLYRQDLIKATARKLLDWVLFSNYAALLCSARLYLPIFLHLVVIYEKKTCCFFFARTFFSAFMWKQSIFPATCVEWEIAWFDMRGSALAFRQVE